jgi:hypothetical protein
MSVHRAKLSTTVESELLDAVDAYVADHAGLNRGLVVDEALRLWAARLREQAIEAQYAETAASEAAERMQWRQLRRAAATRILRPEYRNDE